MVLGPARSASAGMLRNMNYNVPPPSQTYRIRTPGMGHSNLCFIKLPADSDTCLNLRTTVLGNKGLFFVVFFFLFRAAPIAYGSSWSRGQIGAAADTYTTAYGNTESLTP